MEILGSKELMEQVRNKDLCTVCGACVGICPYHKAHKGKIAMTFDCDIAQGQCFANCPRTDVDFEELSQRLFGSSYDGSPLGTYRKITASKAGDAATNTSHQNGGTVSALMQLALEKGMIGAAVLTGKEGIIPKPRIVTKVEEVAQCASTRYMAAPTVSMLNQSIAEGYEKIGIVGTACQLTGVGQIRGNLLGKEDFKDVTALTIGLCCTWSLYTRQFLEFLADRVEIDSITGMDVPPPPSEILIVKTDDKTIEIPLSDIRAMVPKGCSQCPDMTAEWSDVSVGAFEGKPEWNTLIIRTEKGEQLVDLAVREGYLTLDDFPADSLEHLSIGAGNKKKRALETAETEEK